MRLIQPRRVNKSQPTIEEAFGDEHEDPTYMYEDDMPTMNVVVGGGDEVRRRGRPTLPRPPLFDDTLPAIDISLTIVKRGDHVPFAWMSSLNEFLDSLGMRYYIAFERGGIAENLHIQAVITLNVETEKMKELIKAIKDAIGVRHGDGQKCGVCCKPLVAGQTFERMLGYCAKDEGMPHFRSHSKDVTRQEIDRGKEEYGSMKLSYLDNKIMLTKSNLFNKMHSYYTNNIAPRQVAFPEVLAEMINSNKYIFAATVLMSAFGQMREDSAEAYWSIIMGQKATKEAMKSIIYVPQFSTASRFTPNYRNPDMLIETTATVPEAGPSEAGPSGVAAEAVPADSDED